MRSGGVQKPIDKRIHDYNDAVAILGIKSNPNTISSFSTNSLQIRNDDGSTYINVTNGVIKLSGSDYSLIKTDDLVSWLNTHVHSGPGTSPTTPLVQSTIENNNVVHG
jgi:hypothetical protein